MNKTEKVQLPRHVRSATVRSESFADDNTIDVVWTTGADVQRVDPWDGAYIERLCCDPDSVRLDRLNSGAPFLDTHNAYELGSIIGAVVKGSARMEDGVGVCKVVLSQSDRAADTVADIRAGIISNVSVGYAVYAFTRTETNDGTAPIMLATDWEPLEISAVPVPADAGAGIQMAMRSQNGVELNNCTITRSLIENQTDKEASVADEKAPIAGEDKKVEAKVETKAEPKVETKVEANTEKTEIDHAADKAGVHKDEVLKVEDNIVTTKANHEITDPADAHPSKTIERKIEEAVVAERARSNEIMKIARGAAQKYGSDFETFGREHNERGTSTQAFRNALLDALIERGATGPVSNNIDLSAAEKPTANTSEAGREWARKLAPKIESASVATESDGAAWARKFGKSK